MEIKVENLNQLLIKGSKLILYDSVERKTRGFTCYEIPEPVLFQVSNPTDRYVNIPARKWNRVLPWIESMWIAGGVNSLKIPGSYVKNLYNFSDNGYDMRAGYGPRIRRYSPTTEDYTSVNTTPVVDQLLFVIETLKKDPCSRQASITIHDPNKDCFRDSKLLETKDQPCTRTIQFMVVNGALDCTVTMRSNDLIWGTSAVNVFNFTFMQEYVANILGMRVGKYNHFVNNLHVYEDKIDLVKSLSTLNPVEYESDFGRWEYRNCEGRINGIKGFDHLIKDMFQIEKVLREGDLKVIADTLSTMKHNSILTDFIQVLVRYYNKKRSNIYDNILIPFNNPYLNKLYNE